MNISPIKKIALSILDKLRENVVNGDCSDEELSELVTKIPQPKSIDPNEYCNYDKALDILGLGNNRTKLNELCKKHHIVNHKVNNQHIGFKIKEIEQLLAILRDS